MKVPWWFLHVPEEKHRKAYIFIDAPLGCKEAAQFCDKHFKVILSLLMILKNDVVRVN